MSAKWMACYFTSCCYELGWFTIPLTHETNPVEKKNRWSHTSCLSLLYARIHKLGYWRDAPVCMPPWHNRALMGYDNISWRTNQESYPVSMFALQGILHINCSCMTLQHHSIGGLWVEWQQCALHIELHVQTLLFSSQSTFQSMIITEATVISAYQFLMIIAQAYCYLRKSPIQCIETNYLAYLVLCGLSICITYNTAVM